ncbi:TPA: hypothetical protein ACJJ9I_000518 [Neisseria meningitidis]|uniref:hypothetical protein n=1 Tax=Neisseria meningitidis TaxID=487 RepID=UPI00027C8D5A|nr:hypothetical protein [Neisseria meningitidis]EJU80534.1 putative lipoprotein [Neisseria meningitidis NM3081]ELL29485.1 putative lipoprotein [Neisseria meningitidis 77221]
MSRLFLLLFPCAILAACTRNISASPAVSDCAHLQNRTVLYFDAHGKPADSAVKGGFYKIIKIQGANRILIQDFNSTGNALGGSYVPDCRKSSLSPKNI